MVNLGALDIWSVSHFIIFGFIMMFLVNLLRIKNKHKYAVFFMLLILWELIEKLFSFGMTFGGFFPTNTETPLNIFSDIAIGMLGGIVSVKTIGKIWKKKFQ